ncbi:MAG: hypothetical protein M3Z02_03970 [Actinomycetota bacterium]|nr:hypothetical protein [Actinomycetota bacterium]
MAGVGSTGRSTGRAAAGAPAGQRPGERAVRPLLVSEDPLLVDDVARLGAVAGVELEVASGPAAARPGWSSAPVALVGGDAAQSCAGAALPRRSGVVLVSRDLDDAAVWQRGVALGAEHVIFLPDAESWLVSLMAEAAEGGTGSGVLVGVIGGRGGAGASVLAAALAVTALRAGHRSMLVDADPLGGGLDLVLGAETAAGLRWPDLVGSRGRVSGPALLGALPQIDELTVLSWSRGRGGAIPAPAMGALLAAGLRSSDLVVVDLPRQLDAAAAEALSHADQALVLIPAEVRACAAAARVAAAVVECCADVRLVVRGPAPAGLSAASIASSLGLPLAGDMRAEPGLARALERGHPPARRSGGPLAGFCAGYLGRLLAGGRTASAA